MLPTRRPTSGEKGGMGPRAKITRSCSGPYGAVCSFRPIYRTLRAAPPSKTGARPGPKTQQSESDQTAEPIHYLNILSILSLYSYYSFHFLVIVFFWVFFNECIK